MQDDEVSGDSRLSCLFLLEKKVVQIRCQVSGGVSGTQGGYGQLDRWRNGHFVHLWYYEPILVGYSLHP